MNNNRFALLKRDLFCLDFNIVLRELDDRRHRLTVEQASELLLHATRLPAFPESVERRNQIIAKLLTEKNADPNYQAVVPGSPKQTKWSPIGCALEEGNLSIIELMLDHDAQLTREKLENGQRVIIPVELFHNSNTLVDKLVYNESKLSSGHLANVFDLIFRKTEALKGREHRLALVNARAMNLACHPTLLTMFIVKHAGAHGHAHGHVSYLPCIDVLLRHGADPTMNDGPGKNDAIATAAVYGSKDLLERFLPYATQEIKDVALCKSIQQNQFECARVLLEAGANPNTTSSQQSSPLYIAACKADSEFVNFLVDKGADVKALSHSSDGPLYPPLASAACHGRLDIAKSLVERGADVDQLNSAGEPVAITAISNHHVDVAIFLIQHSKNKSLLIAAFKHFSSEDIAKLFDAIPEFMANNSEGETPLHVLLAETTWSKRHQLILELLLARGINPGLADNNGVTPFLMACQRGHFAAIVRLHQQDPILISTLDRNTGCTPLMYAVMMRKKDTVSLLLKLFPHNKEAHKAGLTALDMACKKNFPEIVKVLLEHKCNPNSKPDGGFSSLEMAVMFSNQDIITLLLQHELTDIKIYEKRRKANVNYLLIAAIAQRKSLPILHILIKIFYQHAVSISCEDSAYVKMFLSKQANTHLVRKIQRLLPSSSNEEELADSGEVLKEVNSLALNFNLPEDGISGSAYLKSIGYTEDDIKQIKNNNDYSTDEVTVSSSVTLWQEKWVTTWGKQQISTDQAEVRVIRNGYNCYLYIDVEALAQQSCSRQLIEKFNNMEAVFNASHIKKINTEQLTMNVLLPGANNPVEVKISHELKLPGLIDRVYVFQLVADNSRESLFWACFYDKSGLHEQNDIKSLIASTKVISLHAPTKQAKVVKEVSESSNEALLLTKAI